VLAARGPALTLTTGTWNVVQVRLSALAGSTIDQVRVGYDQPRNTGPFRGYLDDIDIISD
jgi:hypothetical protein